MMKGKIKKTFLDILFEPEEETAITKKEKASSRKEVENNIVDSLNRRSDVNAKDVLYRKSAFIDLDDHRKSKDQ